MPRAAAAATTASVRAKSVGTPPRRGSARRPGGTSAAVANGWASSQNTAARTIPAPARPSGPTRRRRRPPRAGQRRRRRRRRATRAAPRGRGGGGARGAPEQQDGEEEQGRAWSARVLRAPRRRLAPPMGSRVALVHDFLLDLRGAERVFAAICDAWPEADVFSAVYDERGHRGALRRPRACSTSFLQRLRPTARTFRALLPLYPHAVESLDLRGYDIVISSSSAWAHGVLVDPGAVHVCYCHNPFRYAWSEREATLRARDPLVRPALRAAAQPLAPVGLDRRPARRPLRRQLARSPPAACAATSAARRPCCTRRWRSSASARGRVGEHYLVLVRADGPQAHRRRDPRVQRAAAGRSSSSATGPRRARLRAPRRARPSASRPAAATRRSPSCCARCRALVVPAAEEFGIAAVEALASGRPVLAPPRAAVLESVEAGVTGAFFGGGDARGLADCVRALRRARRRSGGLRRRGAALRARALPGRAARGSSTRRSRRERRPRAGERAAVRAGPGQPSGPARRAAAACRSAGPARSARAR